MAKKKGNPVAMRLEAYREALDQIRHYFPQVRLTPTSVCFFEQTLSDTGVTQALTRAVKFLGLDVSDPANRDLLLFILADVVFGERNKGRPLAKKRKWDRLTLIQLAVDCNKVKEDMPRISDKRAAHIIKDRYLGRYKHASGEMIRQYLPDARRWLENENRIRADRGVMPLTSELIRPVLSVE